MVVRRVYGWAKQQTHCFLFHTPVLQDDSLFTTSWFVPQPLVCAARTVIFAYCLGVLVTNLAINVVHGAGWNWAAYFTTLTYVGITMYFGVAAYNTAVALLVPRIPASWRQRLRMNRLQEGETELVATSAAVAAEPVREGEKGRVEAVDEMEEEIDAMAGEEIDGVEIDAIDNANEIVEVSSRASSIIYVDASRSKTMAEDHMEYERRTGVAQRSTAHQAALAAQWILYESFTCFAPLVTIVYWALLYPTSGGFAVLADVWMGVSMHAVNSVLMAVEVLALSRIPYALTHLSVLLTFMTLYLGLTYFMVAVYGFYVYPFFEARYFGGYIAIVCLLVVDIVAIIWVVMVLFHYWRDRAYPRWAAALKMRRNTGEQQTLQGPATIEASETVGCLPVEK
ncbi:hypothetical protein IW140_005661 [Coemansia sp. RSA 1813]|nr:hypothetical protein LPJ74_005196 [Coemansia sp. RSA 1843]KAJ2087076.1 hypothetical protein IW138_005233 [Coemansia sp. RSA 986]KAJ2212798.1 hypothetical protein EV179_004365 [Coemansia sp. RSA 487]KAJ2564636.1 hypothetical protein IW140_005661 [Coemansia sp. RSA 1813]